MRFFLYQYIYRLLSPRKLSSFFTDTCRNGRMLFLQLARKSSVYYFNSFYEDYGSALLKVIRKIAKQDLL